MNRLAFVIAAFSIVLAGCSGGSQQSSSNTTTAQSVTSAPSAGPSATVAPSAGAATTAPSPSPSPTPRALAKVNFTDIKGIYAETAIKDEAALGVFPSTTGKFNPYAPITRAEYVRWLVTANNIYFKDQANKQIRLAEADSDQTFVDVPRNNPDFKYIQGMANAGFLIGIDARHFAPSRNMTREEMIAILVSRDNEGTPLPKAGPPSTWTNMPVALADSNKISKPYWGAFQTNNGGGGSMAMDLIHRIFGNTKIFNPQRTATRAEAAVALQAIGFGTFNERTAEYALSQMK